MPSRNFQKEMKHVHRKMITTFITRRMRVWKEAIWEGSSEERGRTRAGEVTNVVCGEETGSALVRR